jgi:hypothetical protein
MGLRNYDQVLVVRRRLVTFSLLWDKLEMTLLTAMCQRFPKIHITLSNRVGGPGEQNRTEQRPKRERERGENLNLY